MLQAQNKTHPLSGFRPEHGVSRAPEKITERARKLQYVRPNSAIRQILGRPGYL